MILAVGYRVQSPPCGTQFRQWATANLEEYLVKSFIMDDQRLREPGGWDRSRKPHPLAVVFPEQAELRAKGRQDLTLEYWQNNVDRLLEFNDRC
ncbi:virulence RhuM family protein [Marinimicrobium sp. C6131]|uniref:RhuM family protein n=1 Tax=Marinimicrobium sp. C6131 TaxID=3022676 RepID=UPI00223CECAB|nr:RhuM family protein [Marinimicrobium sp. C6131]UZJ44235.1 virulence RhuM family protein [Marinimicrobium sp. C6131]